MSAVTETTGVQVVSVSINGREVQGRPGQTILEVARAAGVDIPTLCHDPRLEPYGACRMCLVEVEGARGPMAACGTAVRDGMKIQTHSDKIVKMRKFILELLLTNHPLDCPVCEAAGDCRLQDYAYEYLVDMVPWGWRPPQVTRTGEHPNVAHFPSRCILCGRCVRICREVMGICCWGYINRGYDSEVDTPYRLPLKQVDCVSCGQCISTCPVGSIVGQRTPNGARAWQTATTVTTCGYCADGCRLVLHSYQGRVVRVDSQTEKGLNGGNLCVKGRFGMGYVDSADRLTAPLVRNSDGALEVVSWDDALRYVAEKIKSIRGAKGGQAVGAICGTHCTNEAGYLLQKLMRTVIGSNNVDTIDHAEQAASDEALGEAVGGSAATNSRRDLDKADVILVVGANLTESHPVLALDVVKAARQGKTLIVVDPRRTELAAKATLHLAPKPGTDLALLRAVMRLVLDLDLVDFGFVDARTEGFAALRGMLGAVDVSIEAATSGIAVESIHAAAAAFGQARAAVTIFGTGVVRGPKAAATAAALTYLALMTGNVGKPGAGLIPLRSGANSQGLADMGVRPDRLPGGVLLTSPEAVKRMEAAWGVSLGTLGHGGSVGDMLGAVNTGGLEVLYVVGADPALALPDEKGVRALLDKAAFVVVQDSFLTETAAYADVVLPSSVTPEDEGTFTNGERFVQRVRAAVPSRGDSQPDWAVVQAMANRLGADWSYQSPVDVMREIAEVVPSYGGISYARLEEEGLQVPCVNLDSAGAALLYEEAFPSGKASFALLEASEAGAVTDKEFPLALVTGTVREHHGTGVRSRRSPGLTNLEPEAALEISEVDAAEAKLTPGDRVRVVSHRGGSVETVARVSARVPAGVVFLPGFSGDAPVTRLQGREGSTVPAVRVEKL